ncbi:MULTISPECIES: HPP family protein [unclassified Curtobacterium]|uniref:HPP family protein n=1 Tax=unclassified Curtobacterium TaxID=257496 RepID=UPI000D8C3F4F|nr:MULTISPECIES: HPP family protein [unclassified Curtobacterium]PYY55895.1 HPP family protein [Curtobacterium sp. MCSS17_011]WIE79229.1 HPP family protein [Curtobacterium sp. MCSS17_016]
MSTPADQSSSGQDDTDRPRALVAALLCLVVLTISGAVGLATAQPWLFPSLGPTVMLFFTAPKQHASRPMNALVGHLVAIIVGYGCFLAFGLAGSTAAPTGGLTLGYVAAGAVSVALTTLVLQLIRLPHPPAGATTLIVSLGILSEPLQLLDMAGAVLLVTVAGWALNRVTSNGQS